MEQVAIIFSLAKLNSTQKETNDTLSAINSKLLARYYDDDGNPTPNPPTSESQPDFYVLGLSGVPVKTLNPRTGVKDLEVPTVVFMGVNPGIPAGVQTALDSVSTHTAYTRTDFSKDKSIDDMNVQLSSIAGQQGYTNQCFLQPGDSFSAGNVDLLLSQFDSIV